MYKQAHMSNTLFTQMPLITPIQSALKETGYTHATPIQEQSIPLILNHHDLLGIAQTGTGKTAAFCLPIIQNLYKTARQPKPCTPRALILAPTRELCIQIHENLTTYSRFSKLTSTVVFGGVSQNPQVKALESGVDILVATTGRLLDLIQQGYVKLNAVEVFVLDEADRMLDMGFFPDINRLLTLLPKKRQNLFFSATMPREVDVLAKKMLNDPKRVEVTPQSKTADRVQQSVYYVDKTHKLDLLMHLLQDNSLYKVIVFVEMKHAANRITDRLSSAKISAVAIHSDKSQNARQRALEDFKQNKARVLVATDIAARGIDVDGITHVVNFDLSHLTENYVHRIGRTARAGAEGIAISFADANEKSYLYAIEKETKQKIQVITDHPYHSEIAENAQVLPASKVKAMLESQRIANKMAQRKGGGKSNKPARQNFQKAKPHGKGKFSGSSKFSSNSSKKRR